MRRQLGPGDFRGSLILAEQVAVARETDVDILRRRTAKLGEEHPTTIAVAHNLSIDMDLLGE
jgi:hypothetical protein